MAKTDLIRYKDVLAAVSKGNEFRTLKACFIPEEFNQYANLATALRGSEAEVTKTLANIYLAGRRVARANGLSDLTLGNYSWGGNLTNLGKGIPTRFSNGATCLVAYREETQEEWDKRVKQEATAKVAELRHAKTKAAKNNKKDLAELKRLQKKLGL